MRTIKALIIILVAVGCQRKPFDYRNKYIGNWEFSVEEESFYMADSMVVQREDYRYSGSIDYGEQDDELLIEYGETYFVVLVVDKDAQLSDFPSAYSSGDFDGEDKIHLYLRWGGLGGGSVHVIEGEKK